MMDNINNNGRHTTYVSEIEEGESSSELFEISGGGEITDGSMFSYDIHQYGGVDEDDIIYVAVLGKNAEDLSMDALNWTLNHALRPSSTTTLYLIHIFPEIHYIPTPLGKLPISQVNKEQKNNHMVQERNKRSQFLQKFLDRCSYSKVKVETILIESDTEAKAIVQLIPILNIKTLVVGTTKSSLRRLKAGKGSGIAEEIQKMAPDFCEVKMICEGKQVSQEELMIGTTIVDQYSAPTGSPRAINMNNDVDMNMTSSPPPQNQQLIKDKLADSLTCGCFKPKAIS